MTTNRWVSAAVAVLIVLPAAALAGGCRTTGHDGRGYTVCEATAGEDVRVWLTAPDGGPLATFDRLRAVAEEQGQTLVFAMNGGMYHPDRRPVGLLIEDGETRGSVLTGASDGNFGMLPNGVFCVLPEGFAVIESRAFAADPPQCRHATQSGPMLVIDGALHPRFIPGSDSLYTRNGVGVSPDGKTVWFAISDGPVNFHDFATFFRDGLGARNALFLDGSISRLYAPEVGRDDFGFPMGPIVGMVAPMAKATD